MKIDRKEITGFAHDYRVTKGAKFRLKDFDPGDTQKLKSSEEATCRRSSTRRKDGRCC
jgi:hypothetical protein